MSRRQAAGFTLFELMIVVVVFGIVAMLAYGGLQNVLANRVHLEAHFDRSAALQRAYLRLRDDFQQLSTRRTRDEFGERQPAFVADSHGVVVFTRAGWRNPAALPRPELQVVAWRLDGERLLRSHHRQLDRAQAVEPEELVVLDGLRSIQWRFLDRNHEWQAEWPPTRSMVSGPVHDPGPPLGVELLLESDQHGSLRFLFRGGVQAGTVRGPQGGAP